MKRDEIIKQVEFCNILMNHLNDDVLTELEKDKYKTKFYNVENYTRMINDITKLRIELNKLSKILKSSTYF